MRFLSGPFLFVTVLLAFTAGAAAKSPPTIVIGFLGGFVRRGNSAHSVVQVAERLRRDYSSGVYAAAYGNHQVQEAQEEIRRLLDTNSDGRLSDQEKRQARIILYGHSWGAAAAIHLARRLGKEGIPVLLTIQVDSISKPGQDDRTIPPNVAQAANFYQSGGILHGQPHIRAADTARTQILGNFHLDYKTHHIPCPGYPWYDHLLMRSHIEIECDPEVWNRVEELIRSKLPSEIEAPATATTSGLSAQPGPNAAATP